ncbi:cytochrome b/b6 domain-containing protein [Promicromonospora sp. NFX87]|uniref:cytochrome b/b6 domain-containing protein n=1 Tax=Promicromonospora sp. NFX87 TaxID=3402691 RepID=UPI003AFA43A9
MATFTQGLRQGLPRHPGGPGWPPAGAAPAPAVAEGTAAPEAAEPALAVAAAGPAAGAEHASAPADAVEVTVRRGLPRVAGGEPWPPAAVVRVERSPALAVTPSADVPAAAGETAVVDEETVTATAEPPAAAEVPVAVGPVGPAAETVTEQVALRRGLPRVAGGEPWPAAETVTVQRRVPVAPVVTTAPATVEPSPAEPADVEPPAAVEPAPEAPAAPVSATEPARPTPPVRPTAPARPAEPAREPRRIGSRTLGEWARILGWGLAGVVAAAGIIVLAARGVTTLPGVPEFLERYPGSYDLPESAPVGFPVWANWMHYLNFFFMVLIVRTGLQVRYQKTPPAYWTPAKGGKKISINLWLHTGIDLLWLANGAAFVVLLFVTGHWIRIVPTSWEVFPNAASAMLQYLTLEWPTEHGWVNYNSLQQLMYFTVVFVAAPLAAITGLRMSEWWPKNAERLNRIYPAPVARAIHFPTMLFFVLFVIVHVTLVFATGALRNLNHMFAAQDTVSWVGFAWFAGGLVLAVAAVVAARPLVIAPIASLVGKVSSR